MLSYSLMRTDASINMARFYIVSVQQNLFGQYVTSRQWGRIGTRGQKQEDWFGNKMAANDAAATLLRAKVRRGYTACQ